MEVQYPQETEEHGNKDHGLWAQATSGMRSAPLLASYGFVDKLIL